MANSIRAVVAGGLGTDVCALGLNRLVGPGELEFGGKLHIGAGGKSRNIAAMMAALLGKNAVAMVGRTSRDPLGLWRVPVDALVAAGVNVDFVRVVSFEEAGKYPQLALIAVDTQGRNQIYVLPGVNEDFSADDITAAGPVLAAASANKGMLVLSLELPLATAVAAIEQANAAGLKIALDPGGIRSEIDYSGLLQLPMFLLKPNQHEAEILTGVKVAGLDGARTAAARLLEGPVENVLITLGGDGAYLANKEGDAFIPAPAAVFGDDRDETGCGDQTMAAVCASIIEGRDIADAARVGILAGTLQFCRAGIVPVTRDELSVAIAR